MKNIFKLIILITLFSSCKKEKLEGDFATLEGKYRCIYKYTEATVSFEYVSGTELEHDLILMDCGKYKLDFSNEKSQRGRIVNITKINDYFFDVEMSGGYNSGKETYHTGVHRFSLNTAGTNTLYIEVEDGSMFYERIQ